MKKRVITLILSLVMVLSAATAVGAYTNEQLQAAEALYHLNLFQGRSDTAKEFDLDSKLNRAEGLLLLIRLLGKEEEAATYDVADTPFTDIADFWGGQSQFIAYAYQVGMVDGMTDTEFAPRLAMNDQMFLTLALRVLGYQDGETENYVWNNARRLAYEAGLVNSAEKDAEFTRGDAALVCWKALKCKLLDGTQTLSDRLMCEGLFDVSAYNGAKEIWIYGYVREEDADNGSGGGIGVGDVGGSSGGGDVDSDGGIVADGEYGNPGEDD